VSRGPLASAIRDGVVVLDGGLATELERRGHDVSSDLWSARVLRDDPAAVLAAHRAYLSAGAQVITTASYQATFEGFATAGVDRDEAAALLRRSVELARAAIGPEEPAWVAASVGPYGAMLAGGQEYTGEYVDPDWPGRAGGGLGVAELRAFHRPRLEVLADAGPDALACETVPCLAEAEALLAEVDRLGVPAWLSLTTLPGPDGEPLTRRGEPAAEAFAMAAEVPAVLAVGVNCVAPQGVAAAVRTAATASGGRVAVAYPNSGETWDGPSRTWRGRPGFAPDDVAAWTEGGARLVGGCCRVGPEQIAELAAAVRGG
jgi:homocysteine S-methyltransferase